MTRPTLAGILATAVLLLAATPASAQTRTWDGDGAIPPDGDFFTANNWDPDFVPTSVGTALFNIADTYTVSFMNDPDNDSAEVLAGDVSFVGTFIFPFAFEYDLAADLTVRGGTLNVVADLVPTMNLNVGAQLFIGDVTADGTVIVSGSGARLDAIGATFHSIGDGGQTGTLTYQSAAQGTISGPVLLGVSLDSASQGNLNVLSIANLTTASLHLSDLTSGTGNVTVDGAILTQSGASILTAGSFVGGAGTLTVSTNGVFTSGTGGIDVYATGTLNVGLVGGGTFNANGDVFVDDGTIMRGATGNFNLASGLTLTATGDAQINFTGSYNIDQGTTFDIQSGADFSTTSFLDIGVGGDGTLLVDGPGSSVMTGAGTSFWGIGNAADVTFRMGSTGNLGEIELATSNSGGTTGIFNVDSAATVTTDNLEVATGGGATTTGTITVNGGGSSLTQNGTSNLYLGHASTGTATINVTNGGVFTTGTGLATIDTTGTINVNTAGTFNALGDIDLAGTINLVVGTLSAVDLNFIGGTFNFASGTLELNSNQTLDVGRLADLDVATLSTGQIFRVNATSTLLAPMALAGGTFEANGPTTIDGGLIDIGAGGTFNANGNVVVDFFGEINRGSTGDFNLASGLTLTASNTAQINFAGSYDIDQGTTFDIQSGADLSTTGGLDIGIGSDGTLLVDGGDSSVTTASTALIWGGKRQHRRRHVPQLRYGEPGTRRSRP